MSEFLRQYLTVAIFAGAAVLMVGAMLGVGRLLRPTRPQAQKYLNCVAKANSAADLQSCSSLAP